MQVHKQRGIAPNINRVSGRKEAVAKAATTPPRISNSPPPAPLSMPRARRPGWLLRLPLIELVRTKPPSAAFVLKTKQSALEATTQKHADYV